MHLVLQAKPNGLKSDEIEKTIIASVLLINLIEVRNNFFSLDSRRFEYPCISCMALNTTKNISDSSYRL